MNEIVWNNPDYFPAMWVGAAVAVVALGAGLWRRRALRRFAAERLLPSLAGPGRTARGMIAAVLLTAATLAVALGLADPRWGKKPTEVRQRGIDIVFALDVSRSMQARDATPYRLARASQYITDMLDELGGDRVALVCFGGSARQIVPLTTNYSDVKMALQEVGPHTVTRGGSSLADALDTAAASFVDETADHKAIVLLTDGEDHGSDPADVAREILRDTGIRVFTVGLGDPNGSTIPTGKGRVLTYNGQPVVSKMQGKTLEDIALAGGGAYIPAGVKTVDMPAVYRQHIGVIPQREYRKAMLDRYIPRYQWLIGPAVALLLAEMLLVAGLRRREARTQ